MQGWVSLVRKPGLRRDLWKRLGMAKISPRYCVYEAAAQLVFRVPELSADEGSEPDSVWNAIGSRLPLRSAMMVGAPARKQVARDIVRNYEEVLIGTRA